MALPVRPGSEREKRPGGVDADAKAGISLDKESTRGDVKETLPAQGRSGPSIGEMIVAELWRYPVKSMQGECLDSIELDERGIRGDRSYGVLDVGSGTVISAKRDGRLLRATATLERDGPCIRLPGGEVTKGAGSRVDAVLSAWLERPVRLVAASPDHGATYERQVDFEVDESGSRRWEGPAGSYVDSSPTHLLTTASLRGLRRERGDLQVEVRRFRPNLVIEVEGEGFVEEGWVGCSLAFARARLQVHKACTRCVVTTREQRGGIPRQLDMLRHINRAHGGNFGVRAMVAREGPIVVGEQMEVVSG